jgi:hypothetical protein
MTFALRPRRRGPSRLNGRIGRSLHLSAAGRIAQHHLPVAAINFDSPEKPA